jgi:outer membrane protein assembly factor BamC
MPRLAWILLIAAGATTAGCSWFSDDKGIFVDRSGDYLTVVENPPLSVPGSLSAGRIQDPAPIPEIPRPLRPEYYASKPPRPDAIHGSDNRDDVRIQRLGERRWLAIPEDPTTVWPKVKQFLAENGVALAREMPNAGRLDTEWLTVGNEPYRDVIRLTIRDAKDGAQVSGGRDRVRVRVEPGLRERTSEVHIRYENDEFSPPAADTLVDLQESASHIGAAEQDLLNELGAYIAARVAETTVSMVAQDMSGGIKSFVERDAAGDPVLRLLVDYQRAWATIGQSLTRANIDVEEADETAGRYLINLPPDLEVGEPEQKGFIRRLFTFGKPDLLTLQIRIEAAPDGSYSVSAHQADGSDLDREFGQEVLVLLREYSS